MIVKILNSEHSPVTTPITTIAVMLALSAAGIAIWCRHLTASVWRLTGNTCLVYIVLLAGLFCSTSGTKELSSAIATNVTGQNAISAISNAFSTAVFEEIFFRGFIYFQLAQRYGYRTAILVSAAIFFVFHATLLPTPLFFGLVAATLTAYCHSILPAIILHLLINSVGYIAESIPAMQQTDAVAGISPANLVTGSNGIITFVLGVIAISYLAYRGRRERQENA